MMKTLTISRPEETEYLPYYAKYVSLVPGGNILEVLSNQLDETLALLRSVPETRAGFRYAEGKWSVNELVGHIIDSERIFGYRALRFARNDRTPLPGFEQDDYIRNASFDACTLGEPVQRIPIDRDKVVVVPWFGLLTPRLREVEAHQVGNQRISDRILLSIAIIKSNFLPAETLRFEREDESGPERGE